jgi:hypothetical protein
MFIAQEILGQLGNIHLHLAAGLKTKSREAWMRDCSFKFRKPIRDPDDIRVEMKAVAMKRVGEALYASWTARIIDCRGGLFTSEFRGVLR